MNKTAHAKKGFTLIELLTVIAILAILGAIIFPTVGQFRTLAKKSSDSSDLRNIVQASQLFAAQNGERLVDVDQVLTVSTEGDLSADGTNPSSDVADVAAVLAFGGELNDPKTWMSANEPPESLNGGLYTASTGASNYEPSDFSFSYVTGLQTSDSANTPVAFTRQSGTEGKWGAKDPYGDDGGHVAFLGGSVSWYETLANSLIKPDGTPASSIEEAVGITGGTTPDTKEIKKAGTPTTTNTGGSTTG